MDAMSDGITIVDAWMQYPNVKMLADPVFEPLRRWTGGMDAVAPLPVELVLAAMDQAGVKRGVLSAWYGPRGPLISNEEVHALVSAHPDRFAGVASVDLHRPMDAVRMLRDLVRYEGFRGLRMLPWLWNLPPNDRRYYPLYAECVELGVPFLTQIGHTGPLCPSEPGRPIPYLDEVLLDFPELVVIAGHVGCPWEAEAISLCRKYPSFYLDTSAYKLSRLPAALVAYLRAGGSKKVLFGSNFPMLMPAQCLEGLADLELTEVQQADFLGGNAARLLGGSA